MNRSMHGLARLRRSVVYETLWRFLIERQAILRKRLAGQPYPWTRDPILMAHRFTNIYRATDRVSQFLIRHVIYEGDPEPREIVFRTLLFKLFNRIETWTLLTAGLGPMRYSSSNLTVAGEILSQAMARGERIYSAAYIMPTVGGNGTRKHVGHLGLLDQMMRDRIEDRLQAARSMSEAFGILRSYPMLGPFLAYQYLIDLNYSPVINFSEMDFVVPGPGALRGIAKCFPDASSHDPGRIVHWVVESQDDELRRRGAQDVTLFGRKLQLVDCQNVFCEVDKYARLAHPDLMSKDGRLRIKQRYRPSPAPLSLWFPPKWGLNDHITSSLAYATH